MRFKLKFKLTKNEVPIEYRKVIMSFIKKCIEEKNKTLFDKYYLNNTNKKEFTFSCYLSNPKKNGDFFIVENDEIFVRFSTSNVELYYLLYSVFLNSKYKIFPLKNDNQLILVDIFKEESTIINSNVIVCKTLSPLCIKEHFKDKENNKDIYYDVNDNNFIKYLKEKYLVDFINIDSRKKIVAHNGLKFQTTEGRFILKGNPYNLQKLYDCGLGSRCGQGFGMFNIISQGGE